MINGLPSLSEIESTTVEHLISLAADFDAEADLIETTFTQANDLMSHAPGKAKPTTRRALAPTPTGSKPSQPPRPAAEQPKPPATAPKT